VYYCFLSHARADAGDIYFATFVADFVDELRARVGAHTTDGLAFFDDSVPLGAAWEPTVAHALRECRTFIAMLSPTYLHQRSCADEWAYFEWRLGAAAGPVPDLLLSLIWIPVPDDDLPPAVRRLRRGHSSFGAAYASGGLRHVVQRGGAEYRELLTAIAEHVRNLVRLPSLTSLPASAHPEDLPDPFSMSPPDPLRTATPRSSATASAHADRSVKRRHLILFLAANPSGTTRLALDEECSAIEHELRMTTGRDDFDFRSKWTVSVDDMMRHFNELEPAVIHFSGHGGGSAGIKVSHHRRELQRDIASSANSPSDGIQLEAAQHQPQYVSARALTQMISSAAPSACVIVLNACFTSTVADELRRVVDCVVGMRGAIGDDAARSFAVGFYRALGHHRSVGNAVAQARATLAAKQLPDEQLPVCLTRDGILAENVILPPLWPPSR
jgi:hypothetical protein